ncbi:MAG: galactokinase family protein [Erysipelotrichia bacterium]|nr:galactokinase family protein [Erysipelotrichia bacterium]
MKSDLLIQRIKERRYDDLFEDIYVDKKLIDYQCKRYVSALENFQSIYGCKDITVLSVPGRSEIGGNHTDHQCGKVLAASINLDMIAVVSAEKSNYINIISDKRKVNGIKINELDFRREETHSSRGLVKGVLKKFDDDFYRIGGFNAYMTSDVPVGSGLSSSAAFEVMVATIINCLYNRFEVDPITIAKYCQYAENVYFGKPSGLMDQMACSVGNLIGIDFADPKRPQVKRIDTNFSQSDYSLCIVDCQGSHASLTDDYAAIVQDMKTVAQFFGKEYLRDVTYQQILANTNELRKKAGDRAVLRALHVISENKRVEKEIAHLKNADFSSFLHYVKESGNSSYKYLQNIYSMKNYQQQPLALALCISENILQDKGVCRVHGGGFAGTIQVFVQNDFVNEYKAEIEKIFGLNSCKVLNVRKYGAIAVFK